jgi:hypothetical protein
MKQLLLIIGLFHLASTAARAEDWTVETRGVHVAQGLGFPGCAPAQSINDVKALKMAMLKAQANMVRSRNTTVSGSEETTTGTKKEQYSLTVYESSESYLKPIMVIDKKLAVIDDVQQLCVLVIENLFSAKENED